MSHKMFLWRIFISGNKILHDKCQIFCPILTKFGVSQGTFIEVTNNKISRKSLHRELRWYMQTLNRGSIVMFFQSRDNTYMNCYFMFFAVTNEEATFLIQNIHIIFILFLRVSQYKQFVILIHHSGKVAIFQVDT